MLRLLKNIVKLSEKQYQKLKQEGSLTINGKNIIFDENTLYITNYQDTLTSPITSIKIVDSLPNVGKPNVCYWLKNLEDVEIYNQYIWINNRYESIGNTKINLDDFLKKEDLPKSMPASDVYDWAKKPFKPNYDYEEINGENSNIEIGSNTNTSNNFISITRNCSSVVHQALVSIYDDGSVRISHRNKSSNANVDDSYIEFGPSKLKYGKNDVLTTNNGYTKKEIDNMIKELKSFIKEQ